MVVESPEKHFFKSNRLEQGFHIMKKIFNLNLDKTKCHYILIVIKFKELVGVSNLTFFTDAGNCIRNRISIWIFMGTWYWSLSSLNQQLRICTTCYHQKILNYVINISIIRQKIVPRITTSELPVQSSVLDTDHRSLNPRTKHSIDRFPPKINSNSCPIITKKNW